MVFEKWKERRKIKTRAKKQAEEEIKYMRSHGGLTGVTSTSPVSDKESIRRAKGIVYATKAETEEERFKKEKEKAESLEEDWKKQEKLSTVTRTNEGAAKVGELKTPSWRGRRRMKSEDKDLKSAGKKLDKTETKAQGASEKTREYRLKALEYMADTSGLAGDKLVQTDADLKAAVTAIHTDEEQFWDGVKDVADFNEEMKWNVPGGASQTQAVSEIEVARSGAHAEERRREKKKVVEEADQDRAVYGTIAKMHRGTKTYRPTGRFERVKAPDLTGVAAGSKVTKVKERFKTYLPGTVSDAVEFHLGEEQKERVISDLMKAYEAAVTASGTLDASVLGSKKQELIDSYFELMAEKPEKIKKKLLKKVGKLKEKEPSYRDVGVGAVKTELEGVISSYETDVRTAIEAEVTRLEGKAKEKLKEKGRTYV